MNQSDQPKSFTGDGWPRRHFLTVGAVASLTGCIRWSGDTGSAGNGDDDAPDRYDNTPDRYDVGSPTPESEDRFDDHHGEDELDPAEQAMAELDFAGFTHFPVDFAAFFANLDDAAVDIHYTPPILPFFTSHKVVGASKWYIVNPHDPAPLDKQDGYRRSEWDAYLIADAVVWYQTFVDDEQWEPSMDDLDLDMLPSETVNGETVYWMGRFTVSPSRDVRVMYESIQLRKAIIEQMLAGDGVAVLPAGTLLGYGMNAFLVVDERVETPGVNPFDYFTEEKQRELLELYQSVYDIYTDEGIHPFTDLTESRFSWDMPGELAGGWRREDTSEAEHLPGAEIDWSLLSLFPYDVLNQETYWRVIEHPWNQENGFIGLFRSSEVGIPSDEPLFPGEPLGESRFYLLEGDLTAGIAMIISRWEWRPLDPEDATNHPSIGERRYLRFEVSPGEAVWSDTLTIQGFLTEDDARGDFTDAAVAYRRYWERSPTG